MALITVLCRHQNTVLLQQILVLVKQHLLLWPPLDWFPRLSWGRDDKFAQPFCHSLVWEGRGRANKRAMSSRTRPCLFSSDMEKNFLLCQKRPIMHYVKEQHKLSTNCCAGEHSTPETVRIPVSCSKDNTDENWPWGEVIAQDEL